METAIALESGGGKNLNLFLEPFEKNGVPGKPGAYHTKDSCLRYKLVGLITPWACTECLLRLRGRLRLLYLGTVISTQL